MAKASLEQQVAAGWYGDSPWWRLLWPVLAPLSRLVRWVTTRRYRTFVHERKTLWQ